MTKQSKTEELLEEINKSTMLSNIFGMYSNDGYAIEDQNIFSENKHSKEISWLYVSDINDIQLIGIKKDGAIFFGHEDGKITKGCEDFFKIPFIFYKSFIENENHSYSDDVYIKILKNKKNEMNQYVEWCKKHNINLKEEDLSILNKENKQEYKFWKGDKITSMTGDNIFVYGANPEFRNGFGAAKVAREFGAKPYGGGRGIVGNTFGLITKNLVPGFVEKATGIVYEKAGEKSVSKEMISDNIIELYQCAKENPQKKFFIAYKSEGRNLNGYSPKEMWELFTENKDVPENIRFHESFREFLKLENNKKENEQFIYSEKILKDGQPRENFSFFWHSPSPFSQWHPSLFELKDVKFTSCEQFMMFCKAKLFKDDEVASKILELNNKEGSIINRFANKEITGLDIINNPKYKAEWDSYQKQIKQLGREVKNYDDSVWTKCRESYVSRGNYEKFSQNEYLLKSLLDTKGKIMVEANPYDSIWANKLKESDPNATNPSKWKGLNLLGKILTNLREKLILDLKIDNKMDVAEEKKKITKNKPKM